MFGGRRFEQRAIDLHRHVPKRQQRLRAALQDPVRSARTDSRPMRCPCAPSFSGGGSSFGIGSSRSMHDTLRDHRPELVVDEIHRADVGAEELLDRRRARWPARATTSRSGRGRPLRTSPSKPRRLKKSRPLRPTSASATSAASLLLRVIERAAGGGLDDVGVEAAAQAAIGGDDDQQQGARSIPAGSSQQRVRRSHRRASQGELNTRSISCAYGRLRANALLRAAQLRRRDHLHGLRDLLRRLDRADAAPDVNK